MRFGAGLVEGADGEANAKDAKERSFGPASSELALSAREDDEVVVISVERGTEDRFDGKVVDGEEVGVASVFDFGHGVDVFGGEHASEREVGDFGGVAGVAVAMAEENERDARDRADAGGGTSAREVV